MIATLKSMWNKRGKSTYSHKEKHNGGGGKGKIGDPKRKGQEHTEKRERKEA